jgi:hypothetical protein
VIGFCMLNPSTADAARDDPTIRRCIGFARSWGYAGVEVVNLFALRATDPRELWRVRDPVGPDNDRALKDATRRIAGMVLAWGAHGALLDRDRDVLRLLSPRTRLLALGWTVRRRPRHPLYLRRDVSPFALATGERSVA